MKKLWIALFLLTGTVIFVSAQNLTASQIMEKLDAQRVFKTETADAVMTMKNNLGTTTESLNIKTRDNGNGDADALITITEGPDQGQKVLRMTNNIYLYYPDAEDVIRIQGASLKDSMFGSNFSYEDLTGSKSTSDSYNGVLQQQETIDGVACYNLMLTAKTRRVAYQKEQLFVGMNDWAVRRVIIFSASGLPIRQMDMSAFKTISGKSVPHKMVVTDLLNKKNVTEMDMTNVEIDIPVDPSTFTRDALSW
jgi:hypothetical protein